MGTDGRGKSDVARLVCDLFVAVRQQQVALHAHFGGANGRRPTMIARCRTPPNQCIAIIGNRI